jgi:hypothetical protein
MRMPLRHQVALRARQLKVKLDAYRFKPRGDSNVTPLSMPPTTRIMPKLDTEPRKLLVRRPNLNDPLIRALPISALAIAMAIVSPGRLPLA